MLWLIDLVLLGVTLLINVFLVREVSLALIVARELNFTILLQQLTNCMLPNIYILCHDGLIFWLDCHYAHLFRATILRSGNLSEVRISSTYRLLRIVMIHFCIVVWDKPFDNIWCLLR